MWEVMSAVDQKTGKIESYETKIEREKTTAEIRQEFAEEFDNISASGCATFVPGGQLSVYRMN